MEYLKNALESNEVKIRQLMDKLEDKDKGRGQIGRDAIREEEEESDMFLSS